MIVRLTAWTNRRLERLFERYNEKFWDGRLNKIKILVADLASDSRERIAGRFSLLPIDEAKILVDPAACGSDLEVRRTLLHEMCHLALCCMDDDHGPVFLSELKRIWSRGAPIPIRSEALRTIGQRIPSAEEVY